MKMIMKPPGTEGLTCRSCRRSSADMTSRSAANAKNRKTSTNQIKDKKRRGNQKLINEINEVSFKFCLSLLQVGFFCIKMTAVRVENKA